MKKINSNPFYVPELPIPHPEPSSDSPSHRILFADKEREFLEKEKGLFKRIWHKITGGSL